MALYLKKQGFTVLVIDSLERSSLTSLLEDNDIPIVVGDLRRDIDIPRVDVIIHAAAYIDVFESSIKPYEYIVNNTAVTGKIAKIAFDSKSHLVYLSSAAVYGEPVYIPINEEHPISPLSLYGLSKWMGEETVVFYGRQGLKYTILRLFNVYGPYQSGQYAGVITKFIERAKSNQPLLIHGDGKQTRDFIHVLDVVRFIKHVVERELDGVFNVGTGRAVSIIQLAEIIMNLTGLNKEPVYADPRPGDIKHSVADISRALNTGWKPSIKLEDGLRELLNTL